MMPLFAYSRQRPTRSWVISEAALSHASNIDTKSPYRKQCPCGIGSPIDLRPASMVSLYGAAFARTALRTQRERQVGAVGDRSAFIRAVAGAIGMLYWLAFVPAAI